LPLRAKSRVAQGERITCVTAFPPVGAIVALQNSCQDAGCNMFRVWPSGGGGCAQKHFFLAYLPIGFTFQMGTTVLARTSRFFARAFLEWAAPQLSC
jgi:hypothetical protein